MSNKPCGCPGGYSTVDGRCTTCNAEPPDPVETIVKYVEYAIESFVKDPPDSSFQRGYLEALLVIWDEALEMPANAAIDEARILTVRPTN